MLLHSVLHNNAPKVHGGASQSATQNAFRRTPLTEQYLRGDTFGSIRMQSAARDHEIQHKPELV